MRNPWDIPPRLASGDAQIGEIYSAVGKALSSWELVEEALAQLFARFTHSAHQFPQQEPAIRAYGSIVSFMSRSEMVQAAGKCFFLNYYGDRAFPFENEFAPLLGQCKGWAGRRNDVAHGRAEQIANGYFLLPGLYNTRKQPLGEAPIYAYTAVQISNFAIAFEDLYDRLSEFSGRLDYWLNTLIQNLIAQQETQSGQDQESPQENL